MRVFSGMQPSGQLHLGNYFGSMLPNLEASKKADESIFFIADLHALTTLNDSAELLRLRHEAFIDYLATGFDPAQTIMFYQSDVPMHAELMWILMTVTPMGLLERAVSYKEKNREGDCGVGRTLHVSGAHGGGYSALRLRSSSRRQGSKTAP
jgi:tryptophanyl-tRNA synthetase